MSTEQRNQPVSRTKVFTLVLAAVCVGLMLLLTFPCACVRRIWHLLTDERSRRAVEIAEEYCEGQADGGRLTVARDAASLAHRASASEVARDAIEAALWVSTTDMVNLDGTSASSLGGTWAATFAGSEQSARAASRSFNWHAERREQADLVRDIFGNVFQATPNIERVWLSPTVLSLALRLYVERAFEQIAELADALVEAGCRNQEILAHCRGVGPHVRGCWVIDLLLGKP